MLTKISSFKLKPIFHHNVNPFAWGPCLALDPQDPQREPIPTCWYPKSKHEALWTQCDALWTQLEACHTQHEPQCESVEYSSRWVPSHCSSRLPCRFHVVCVNFISRWYSQRERDSSGIWAYCLFLKMFLYRLN